MAGQTSNFISQWKELFFLNREILSSFYCIISTSKKTLFSWVRKRTQSVISSLSLNGRLSSQALCLRHSALCQNTIRCMICSVNSGYKGKLKPTVQNISVICFYQIQRSTIDLHPEGHTISWHLRSPAENFMEVSSPKTKSWLELNFNESFPCDLRRNIEKSFLLLSDFWFFFS